MGRLRAALAGRDGGDVRHLRSGLRVQTPPRRLSRGAALAAWGLLLVAAWLCGTLLNDAGRVIKLDAPPLYGTWDVRLGIRVLVPVAVAVALVHAAPIAARRLPWRGLLWLAPLAGLAWGLSLTLVDGWDELVTPLGVKTQYIHAVGQVGPHPGSFLTSFTERIDAFPAHVRAHPPAMVLALWGLARIGLGGPWPAAVFMVGLAATAIPAVLLTARAVAGEAAARRAAPFLVVTPAVLSVVTTADGAYMAVGAWAVAGVAIGIERRSAVRALAGGLLFGVLLFCSYGLVLLGAVPLAVAAGRRRLREPLLAAAAALAVVGVVAAAGFWWLDGLTTTRREYAESVAATRPYWYFVFNNLAAFSIWLGPAVVVALAGLRDRRLWLLVGGGLAAALLADVTGLSKAEVERIWLPFLPWIVLATAALEPRRGLLAAQAATTLAVAVGVRSLW